MYSHKKNGEKLIPQISSHLMLHYGEYMLGWSEKSKSFRTEM